MKRLKKAWKWLRTVPARVYAGLIGILHFLSVLEDPVAGQPRRLSQVRVMVWGAMGVGAYILGKVQFTGEPISWTETGVIGLLTIASGLMKVVRDRQDERGGHGRWGGGGWGGGYSGGRLEDEFEDEPEPPISEGDPFA